jgi:hypothetical protein
MTNHRPVRTLSLSQTIVDNPALRPLFEEALSEANQRELVGEPLWEALFYTGVAVGAEKTVPAYRVAMYEQLDVIRGLSAALENVIPKISDLEVLREVNDMAAKVKEILVTRAQYLTGMHVDAASELYGVPKEDLTNGSDPASWSMEKLAGIGFTAYQKMPMYFYAWNIGLKTDKLRTMKCCCSECMNGLFPRDKKLDASEEMADARARAGGLDALFSHFGSFLITQLREELYRLLEGADEHGTVHVQDAEEAARKMLEIFRKPGGTTETHPE